MNLSDLSDDDLLCDLIGGTFTATDAAELSRRLADLRSQVAGEVTLKNAWSLRCRDAEADRDRLIEAMEGLVDVWRGVPVSDDTFGRALSLARAALAAARKENG